MSPIALLSGSARLVLLVVAAVAAVAALVVHRRGTRPGVVALLTALAGMTLLLVGGERLVSLLAFEAAPRGSEFNEWRWVLLSPWGRGGLILAGLAATATLAFSFLGTRRERSPWRRATLLCLRAGACAAALILFLEPALELRHVEREPNHVAVLVDDSRSMSLSEKKGGERRAARATALIDASAATFERWRGRHHVDFFTFSDTLQPTSQQALSGGVEARADATLLREALEAVRQRYDKEDLAGIIVVSDGTPTGRFADGVADGSSQDFLKGLGTRVHAAWAGRDGLKDLAVARVNADEFAFVRTVVKVEAILRATGVTPRTLPVKLLRDGQLVKEEQVMVGGKTQEARVVFEFTPERIGKYVYEISVPVDPEEAVTANNARAFVLRVIRDKIRVLQVAGRPSWDERALRGLLKADPNVDLISFFILRTPDDVQDVSSNEMSLIPFPTEELFVDELGSFDAVILMNFEYGPYGMQAYLENIRKYVEDGGALAMVGGDLAFSSGNYGQTPVAEVLPVEVLPRDDLPDRLLSLDDFHPRFTSEGQRHPITQLRFERADNEARWNTLPPLEGLNLVAGAKPDATVLMTHPFLKTRAGAPMPVLAVSEPGKGRSLALLTDSGWRWGFVAAGREGDDGRSFQKFWENAIRWLVRDPELEYLSVQADQIEYAPTEAPRLLGRLVDKDYRPARGQEVTIEVVRADGHPKNDGGGKDGVTRKLTTDDAGEIHLDLKPPAPGPYRVTARARLGDKPVTAEDVFLVATERAELEHPAAREDVLQGIAEVTGGTYLGDAGSLPASLAFAPPRVVRVDKKSDVELWSRPWLFFLALSLLGLEWALRRKRGYM